MAGDVRNLFQPFERLPAHHENQLTRALIVVFRLSPMAHVAWHRLLDPERDPGDLPPALWRTQESAIQVDVDEEEEPVPVVSVYLAPERPLGEDTVITASDRRQVLDAIAEYPGALVVVVENKIVAAEDLQARNLNFTGARVELEDGQKAVVVIWRDLLERLGRLLEAGLVAGTEAVVVSDFLAYVEDNFAELGPYRTLALCRRNRFRVERRLRSLLSAASGSEASADQFGANVAFAEESEAIAEKAYLLFPEDGESVVLAAYPADTLSQAREFYCHAELVAAVRRLASEPGWEASPNFHFGHMQRGFAWSWGGIAIEEYLALWQERIGDTATVPREEWDAYWSWLCEAAIVDPADRSEFDRHFTGTERRSATPRPGIEIARRWPIADAEALDSRGELEGEVAAAIARLRELARR